MTPKHSERQAELKKVDEFLLAHPWWRRGLALWLTLAVLNLAELLRLGLDRLAR